MRIALPGLVLLSFVTTAAIYATSPPHIRGLRDLIGPRWSDLTAFVVFAISYSVYSTLLPDTLGGNLAILGVLAVLAAGARVASNRSDGRYISLLWSVLIAFIVPLLVAIPLDLLLLLIRAIR
jgi:hypothetical protein